MEPLMFSLLLFALSLPAGLGLLARLNRSRTRLQPVPVDNSPVTRRRAASSRTLISMGLALGIGLLAVGLVLSVPDVRAQSPGATVGTAKSLAGSAVTGSFPSGQEFTFFVSYSCAAIVDDTCESVVITDTLDPALEFLGVSSLPDGASVSQTGDDVVINLNDLDDGDSGIISVRVRFDFGTLPDTTVTNTATIDAANANPATSNLVTVTSLGNFQMTVNKGVVANAQAGVIGSQFRTTYQLNICNPNNGIGGVPLLNPVITDTLPAGALPVLPIPLGGTYIPATRQIVWVAGQNGFPNEIPVTAGCFTFYVPVYYDKSIPGVISGTNVTNNFQVSGNPADDPTTTENMGPAGQTTTLRDPAYDALLAKSAASPSDHPDDPGVEELPGGPVTYTLTYRNEGTLDISTVVITDVIPPEIMTITTVTVEPITAGQTITLSYELDSSGVWIVDTVTTAPAVVDLSGAPGRVTGLRWELGDVPLDTPAWSAQINAILDDTLTAGAAANNCADGTGTAGGASRLESACVPVDIIYQRAIPRAEKLINDPGPHAPEAVVTYTLRVINDDVAHYNVVAPITLVDSVPEELEVVVFDGGSYRQATGADAWFTYTGAAAAPVATLSPNYGPDNATFLRWQWSAPYQLPPNQALEVSFAVRIKKGTPPGDLDNTSVILWDLATVNPLDCVGAEAYIDVEDIDGDVNTGELGCRSPNTPTSVGVFLSMASEKFVLGELDGGAWNKDGLTVPGGRVDYRMVITNLSNVTTTHLVVYDIFPFVGDTGVVDLRSRASDWRPNLQADIEAPPGVPLSVQYSRSGNPCRPELISSGPPGCTDDWSSTPPADMTSVQAVRLHFCEGSNCLELPPDRGNGMGGTMVLTWTMQAPNDAPVEPERAWNSFGFSAQGSGLTLLPAEPNKVGIRVQRPITDTVNLGDYVWLDVYGQQNDGIQQPQETGINGVRVELRDENGAPVDLDGDGQVDYRITGPDASGNSGYYLFVGLPDTLTYTLRFYLPVTYTLGPPLPVSYNTSPADSGADDALDSDGIIPGPGYIQTGLITVTLALTTDLRWDQGLWLPTDYGDAPDSYNTRASSLLTPANAARHVILPGIYLGASVDDELDGDPTVSSFGDDTNDGSDDENGVTFDYITGTPALPTPVMIIGDTSRMTVSTSVPAAFTGYLNAWIDFNRDGDFEDPGEQIATDRAAPTGGGNINLAVPIPTTAISGTSYARFRFSTEAGLGPSGGARDGEVEDYPVILAPGDFGDLPNGYGTLVASNGARHVITDTNNPTLGSIVDDEFNGQPNSAASGDDTADADDEDGVSLDSDIIPGEVMTVTVTGLTAGLLNAWIDFNNDGDFNDTNERLATDRSLPAGSTVVLTTTVPFNAAQNRTAYARFRYSSQAGLGPVGLALDGEVEDYAWPILPLDYGDLPNTYPTTSVADGARHVIRTTGGNPTLGGRVDAETNGQPHTNANRDDTNNSTILTYGSTPGNDEDGVSFSTPWVFGRVATVTVSALAAASGGADGLLNAWVDLNNDGDLNDAGEQIATNLNLAAGSSQAITFTIPATSTIHNTYYLYSRFRFSSQSNLIPAGLATDGEVEDYRSRVYHLDYGDAPDSFGTTNSANGAYHYINTDLYLGARVDAEMDGQPSADAGGDDSVTGPTAGSAPGDDEDGIIFNTPIAPGAPATITVIAVRSSGFPNSRLNGWIDFNGDGDFDPAERVFTNEPIAGTGAYSLSFTVPASAVLGQQYARFRLSSATLTGPTGLGNTGEVEDYRVEIVELDYGDLPDAYGTLLSSDGARHIILQSGNPTLGGAADSEPTGQPDSTASGDDTANADDEDGVSLDSDIIPGEVMTVTVTGLTAGLLNAWIDFNNDGDFNDTNERLATDRSLPAGSTVVLTTTVPFDAAQNNSAYARFRYSSQAGLGPVGLAVDGEVEDYAWPVLPLDYGDLPAGLVDYPTTSGADGARHVILPTANPTLGATVDAEMDGQPSANADGDDTGAGDDEDGVIFNSLLVPGKTASITVTVSGADGLLSAWVDFSGDGQLDPGEQVLADIPVTVGPPAGFSFAVPAAAVPGPANVRFRFSSQSSLTPAGLAADGEVEDYQVNIVQLDYGDLPDSYQTTDSATGPYHIIDPAIYLGGLVDAETDGQPSVDAGGDDTAGSDDEDGISFDTPLVPGEVATITVQAVGSGNFSGWVDFNGNGSFEPAERVFTNVGLTAGSQTLSFPVPADATTGNTGLRFRYTTATLAGFTGPAPDGEVEDYVLPIVELDFGDLPDGSITAAPDYPTTRADNGARHIITATVYLGSRVDADDDGQPAANADGDDINNTPATPANGSDDEDGIRFLTPLMPGETAGIEVTGTGGVLNAWIDFNADGDFDDVGEQIFTEQVVGSGPQQLDITVPAVVAETLYSRFRLTANTGEAVTPTGLAPNGEVEDYILLSLGNQVWFDSTNDGLLNGAEPGLPGVIVTLVFSGTTTPIATTTTGSNGTYLFTGLVPGDYQVMIPAANFQPGGALFGYTSSTTTTPADSDIDNDDNGLNDPEPEVNGIISSGLTLSPGGEPAGDGNGPNSNLTVDFGFFGRLNLGNLVWYDADNDGQKDPAESGLANVELALLDSGGTPITDGLGNPITATTNADGEYLFTGLISGTYRVRISSTNFVPGGPLAEFISSTPTELDPNSDIDNDDNGPDEVSPGVNGITSNTITITPLSEPDTPVDGDSTNGNLTLDFGFFKPLRLGNRIWIDEGVRNGQIDGGESGVTGVLLNLLDGSGNPVLDTVTGQPITTTTDTNGFYLFTNLISGTYIVEVDAGNFQSGGPLAGYASTTPTESEADTDVDSDDNGLDQNDPAASGIRSGPVTLGPGSEPGGENDEGGWPDTDSNLTVDFGFYRPARLGDYVWLDTDGDGQQAGNEAGLDGVTVNLWLDTDGDGLTDSLVQTTTTATHNGQAGYYEFTGLIPEAAYQVEFVLPPGYVFTRPDQGDDDVDSDARPTTGLTDIVILAPGENNPTLDAGLYRASMALDKAVAVAEIVPNQVVTFTITITNTGDISLNPVVLTDTLDAGLNYIPGSAIPAPDSVTGQRLVWNDVTAGAGLAPGANTRIVLLASVITATGIYRNQVLAEGIHPTGSITGTDAVAVTVSDPAVDLSKEVVPPGVVAGIITFTIHLTNTGPSVLNQVPLFDQFSGPVEYIGGSIPPDVIDPTSQTLAWHDLTGVLGDMAPGQVFVIETVFRVTDGSASFSMTNAARVTDVEDIFGNTANDDSDSVSLINQPTAIELLYFEVQRQNNDVLLNWATAVEIDNFGFRLLRSATGNRTDAVEIAFVPGQGQGTGSGAAYTYTDRGVESNQTYTYWLVDVDLNGQETDHEPIMVLALGQYQLYLPLIVK